jgi:hypothetical protein
MPINTELDDLMRRSETARRQYFAAQPKRAADIMAQLLQRRGYGRVMESQQLSDRWTAAVDPRLRPWTRAVRIYRRRLEVLVANSTVMNEVAFDKQSLLRRFNEASDGTPINDIRFRLGNVNPEA